MASFDDWTGVDILSYLIYVTYFVNLSSAREREAVNAVVSKQESVIIGATEVFLRYGFARTTMGDIAERVGISRPALYLVFPNKEAVFSAVIHRMNDKQLTEIRTGLSNLATRREKLLYACQTWGTHGLSIIAAHPDAKDLFDLSFAPVQEIYAEFQALLAELIAEAGPRPSLEATQEELARTLTFAMRGFRETARNVNDMRRLIAVQVFLLVAATGNAPRASRRRND